LQAFFARQQSFALGIGASLGDGAADCTITDPPLAACPFTLAAPPHPRTIPAAAATTSAPLLVVAPLVVGWLGIAGSVAEPNPLFLAPRARDSWEKRAWPMRIRQASSRRSWRSVSA
jgi:hypothetical protein